MSLDQFMLFLHLATVVVAFCASAIMHFNLSRVRRATRVSDARDALRTLKRLGPIMPLFIVALLLTGGYLTHARWSWSTPWVEVAVGGLIVMFGLSGAVLKPRTQRIASLLRTADDGPMDASLRAAARDSMLWTVSNVQAPIAAGIMFNMVMKPGLGASITAVVVAAGLGAVVSAPGRRAEQEAGALEQDTAAVAQDAAELESA